MDSQIIHIRKRPHNVWDGKTSCCEFKCFFLCSWFRKNLSRLVHLVAFLFRFCVCVLFTYLFSLVKFAVQVAVVTQLSCWYNTFYSESHSNAPEWTENTDRSDSDYVRKIVSLTWNNQFWLILQTDYELLVHFIILSYFIKDLKDFFVFKSVIEFLTNLN